MNRQWYVAFALIVPGAVMAAPEGWPDLPTREECKPLLTVVKENCSVEHVFSCPDGVQRTELKDVDEESMTVEHRQTPFAAWALGNEADGMYVLFPSMEPVVGKDSIDLDRLPDQTGQAFLWLPIFVEPFSGTLSERMQVVDRGAEVDGIAAVRIRTESRVELNGGQLDFTGWEDRFFVPSLGISFTGRTQLSGFGHTKATDSAPVNLIFPGEAGFLENPEPSDCVQIGFSPKTVSGAHA